MKVFTAFAAFALMLAVGLPAVDARDRETEKRASHSSTYRGIAQIDVDYETGRVTRVTMAKSTGSAICDDAAIKAFYRWKFKPRTVTRVKTPITFTLGGTSTASDAKRSNHAMERTRTVRMPKVENMRTSFLTRAVESR